MSAVLMTATNNATYFQNSMPCSSAAENDRVLAEGQFMSEIGHRSLCRWPANFNIAAT